MAVKQTLSNLSMDYLVLKNNGLFQLPYIQNCLCILLALFWLPKFKKTRLKYFACIAWF